MFEKGLLDPAPWHLTGEVDASKRPTDGLLYMQTDFDVNARPGMQPQYISIPLLYHIQLISQI